MSTENGSSTNSNGCRKRNSDQSCSPKRRPRNQRGYWNRNMDNGRVDGVQSQSQNGKNRKMTVAERLLQTFPLPISASERYLNTQHNFAHPQIENNLQNFGNTQERVVAGVHFHGHERQGTPLPGSTNKTFKHVAFVSASTSSSKSSFGAQAVNRNDPHPIDPHFMSNTMSRIARVAGRPVGNFYSTRASDPPETAHVVTHRPSSKLRFSLPMKNESEETIPTNISDSPEIARENLKKLRQWERTTLGGLVGTSGVYGTVGDGTRFTILSYNVLAPSLLETHKYLYKDCSPRSLEWEYRLELFLTEVTDFRADIVCLQEVEAMHFLATYEPRMIRKGFKGIYKKRTRDKEDGCAIFWRHSLFSLVGKLEIEFFQPHVPLLDRDNVGLLVKLQSKIGRRPKLVVGTTHVLYNPRRNDVKLAQVQLLLSELDRFAFSGFSKSGEATYNHIILTGDFNVDPYNSIIRLITDGELQFLSPDGNRPNVLLKKGMTDFIPIHVGISDQCQHYKIVLERYKMFRSTRKNFFEMDLNIQAPLVNLYSGNINHSAVAPRTSAVSTSARRSALDISRPTMSRTATNKPSNEIEVIDLTGDDDCIANGTIINNDDLHSGQVKYNFDIKDHTRVLNEINKSGTVCTFGSGELSHKLRFRSVYAPKLDRTENNESAATTRQNVWTCVDYIFYSMQWSDMQRRRVEGNLKLLRRLGLLTRNQCKQNGHLPSLAVPSDHFPLVAEFLLK